MGNPDFQRLPTWWVCEWRGVLLPPLPQHVAAWSSTFQREFLLQFNKLCQVGICREMHLHYHEQIQTHRDQVFYWSNEEIHYQE